MTDLPILPPADDQTGAALPGEAIFSQNTTPSPSPEYSQNHTPSSIQLSLTDMRIFSPNDTPSSESTQLSVPDGEVAAPFLFTFAGRECHSPYELAQAMADAWDEARKALLSGALAGELDAVSLAAAAVCREATAAVAAGEFTPDRAVLAVIHSLSGSAITVWQGRRYAHGIDLGSSLLQALRGTGTIPAHFDSLMMSGAASVFAEETHRPGLRGLEARYAAPDCSMREKTCLMYMVGFLLCGTAALVMEGETFLTVEQLSAWLETRARRSTAAFTRACHRLLDMDHLLDPQVEAWLIALGRRQDVAKWQAEMDAGML